MSEKVARKLVPLCHRCEYRAVAHETGHGPRAQCTDFGRAVGSCYMYRPVLPVVQEAEEGDDRPIAGPWMMSARMHGIRVAGEMDLHGERIEDGVLLWWGIPEESV